MRLSPFRYHRPTTVEDAQQLLVELGDEASLYAGGTELLLLMKLGMAAPRHLIDLKHVGSLAGIDADAECLSLGALSTHSQSAHAPAVRETVPALAQMFDRLANPRVRHTGTLGGNLCFADPQSDPATLLLVLAATVELATGGGRRRVELASFTLGPYETSRLDDEIVTAVLVPIPGAGTVTCFERLVMHRERPIANAALSVGPDGSCALAVGAITPRPCSFTDSRAPFEAGREGVWLDYARSLAADADLLSGTLSKAYLQQLFTVIVLRVFRAADRVLSAS